MNRYGIGLALAVSACAITASAAEPNPQQIELFETRIRPALLKHCGECHAADSKTLRGGLRLDDPAHIEAGGDSGDLLSRDDPAESLLLSSLKYESFEMPPAGRLPDEVIRDFETWINAGSPMPEGTEVAATSAGGDWREKADFWSFQPLTEVTPPEADDAEWNGNEIDRFVWQRLHQEGLSPVPAADWRTLARRLSYDLTGLPPTPEALAELESAKSAPDWARYVDHLLASPQFGVHWGRHWLDVARYADSNGGDINLSFPHAWRYRDYVVDSFNRDKPYDVFIREQLAGDLLPAESVEQQAEQITATGFLVVGSKMISERDKEKLRMDVVDEQIDTVGKAFLGLTLGCARCHDHKFDPIPTADYYALAGIFRSTQTIDGIRLNNRFVSGWRERELPMPDEQAAAVAHYREQRQKLEQQIADVKKRLKDSGGQRPLPVDRLAGIVVDDGQAEFVGEWVASTHSPVHVGQGYRHDDKLGKGEKQVIYRPQLPQSGRYEVRLSFPGANGRDANVPVTVHAVDGDHQVIVDQTKPANIDGLLHRLGEFELAADGSAAVTIGTAGTSGYVVADAVQFLTPEQLAAEGDAAENQTAELNERLKSLEQSLKELEAAAPTIPVAMAVSDWPEPEDCEIRIRGEVHQTGDRVARGFPSVFEYSAEYNEQISPQRSGRLSLANWVTDPSNPLTPRVAVNRVWAKLFGRGIVASVDNFGHLGEQPSHPELLDHLAITFMQDGWSTKRLIRRIVLSRAYQSSSAYDARAAEVDPDNRLLWRHNRRRLPAESIRDSMLYVSGELDRQLGGPSLAGSAERVGRKETEAESSQRRSLYLPLARGYLPSLLTVFDYPNADLVTGQRPETTVPAQALMLINSEFVRQRAASVAAQIVDSGNEATPQAVAAAFQRILLRSPTGTEVQEFSALVGESFVDPAKLTDVCHVLLASNEFRFLD